MNRPDKPNPHTCKHYYCKCCQAHMEASGNDTWYNPCILCDYRIKHCPDYEPKND